MQTSRNILTGALALAAVAALNACGGGDELVRSAVPGAAAPETQARAAANIALSRAMDERPISSLAPSPAATPDPVAHGASLVDPLVASRVQAELEQVEQGLRLVPDAEPGKREALEVIGELRRELDKDRPNRLKVRGLLGGLAHGVPLLEGWKGAGKFLPQLIPLV